MITSQYQRAFFFQQFWFINKNPSAKDPHSYANNNFQKRIEQLQLVLFEQQDNYFQFSFIVGNQGG